MTEGWLIFVVALGILGVIANIAIRIETYLQQRMASSA
jgi:hypothetical protein